MNTKTTLQYLGILAFIVLLTSTARSQESPLIIKNGNQRFSLPAVHLKLPVSYQQRLSVSALPNNQEKAGLIQNVKIDTAVVHSVLNNPKRYSYLYYSTGNRSVVRTEDFTNGNWVYVTKDTTVFDTYGNLLLSQWKNWTNGQWVNASRKSYVYSSQNSLTNTRTQIWQNGDWVNKDTTYYSYDNDWKKVAFYEKTWSNGKWANNAYEIYTYDTAGQLAVTYRYIWKDSTWENQQRYTFTYDTDGNIIKSTIEDGDRQQWQNFYEETYTYDASNNLASYTGKFWSSNSSTWENSERYTYTYNSSNYRTSAIGEKWTSGQWDNYEKGQYYYDTYGGVETALTQLWKTNAWADTTLAQYVFDERGNATVGDYYVNNGTSWDQNQDGLMEVSYNYNLDQSYYTGYHVEATYPVTTGINNILSDVSGFTCGPNPASATTHIQFTLDRQMDVKLQLYNLNGAVIQSIYEGTLNQGYHRYTLNLGNIPSGIYLATLSSGNRSQSIKIITAH